MLNMPIVGTIHNLVKTQQLEMKWQLRRADPKMEKGTPEERQIARFQEQAAQARESNVVATIDGKLKAGQNISDDELEYLRVNCPDLYKKAVEVAIEREQYKKALENCKTKEDVERLNANKTQRFLSETKAIRSNPNIPFGKKVELLEQITRRMMSVRSEHAIFTGKPEYADLPREAELEEGRKKKQEKSVAELEQDTKLDKPHLEQKPEESESSESTKPSDTGGKPVENPVKPAKAEGDTPTPKPGAAGKYAAIAKGLPEGTYAMSKPSAPVAKAHVSISKRA